MHTSVLLIALLSFTLAEAQSTILQCHLCEQIST